MTPTELRANLYRVLDQVAETGIPREIKRGDTTLLIVPASARRRSLDELPKRPVLSCSIDELVETSWENAWLPEP